MKSLAEKIICSNRDSVVSVIPPDGLTIWHYNTLGHFHEQIRIGIHVSKIYIGSAFKWKNLNPEITGFMFLHGDSLNSLAPGKFKSNLTSVTFKLILGTDGRGIRILCEIALRLMSLDFTGKSTLVQVMAWCCQATGPYLRQCWPSSLSPYGITRPQWVKVFSEWCFQELAASF